jgi:hypothetical protein
MSIGPRIPGLSYVETISPETERAIGQGIAAWSRVERVIEELIWRLLQLDPAHGRVITSKLDARHKFTLLRGFADLKLTAETARERFLQLMGNIEDLYEIRNSMAHGVWVTLKPKNVAASMSLRDKLPGDADKTDAVATEFPIELLRESNANMVRIANQLIILRDGISPSPTTPSPPSGMET